MRLIPTLAIAATVPALAITAVAQVPGEDSTQSRTVRQAGAPSAAPTTLPSDSLFRRAEQLVREGRAEAGRALVDTLLGRARPGSAGHAQALYWRASLAADAAEAERGYRRVIVEYPATGWAGDALLNLAQLEMARGDQEQALLHLHRFEREYRSHESRARAALWLARLHFDKKHEARGCAALATARVAASPEDVELRNQIDYHAQRCIGVDTAAGVAPPRAAAAESSGTQGPAGMPSEPAREVAPSSSRAAAAVPDSAPSGGATPDTLARTVPPAEGTGPGGFTVQVAAFHTRAGAEALIARLKARGHTARLASSARPFRVRIGRYDTRGEALAAQRRLKAKGLDGFVTETEKP